MQTHPLMSSKRKKKQQKPFILCAAVRVSCVLVVFNEMQMALTHWLVFSVV